MELWRAATRISDAVAPMLYHYSWHCFNSFFIYTFFGWDPQHGKGHGINIPSETLSEDIENIEIRFDKKKRKEDETTGSLFQRLIDTWTLLGAYLAFSPLFPIFESDKIEFIPNEHYLLKNSNRLSVKQLLDFDPTRFQNEFVLKNLSSEKIIKSKPSASRQYGPLPFDSIYLPNNALKSYLIIFVASTLARYRPNLWNSVIIGEKRDQAQFATSYRVALRDYTMCPRFGEVEGECGLVYQVSHLLGSILNREFEFKK